MPRKPAHEQVHTPNALQASAFERFARPGDEAVPITDLARSAWRDRAALARKPMNFLVWRSLSDTIFV
ncbi:MAG: hypothetical protein ACPGZP_04245 [Panacagrimonas sp.]